MQREVAKIWAGWLESMDQIPDRASRAELALAIFEYALDDRPYEGANTWVKVLFPTIVKTIDRSVAGRINGSKGGNPNLTKATGLNPTLNEGLNPTLNEGLKHNKTIDNRQETIDNEQETIDNNRDNAPAGAALAFDFRRQLIKDGTDAQVAADFMRCRKAKRLANTRTAYDQMQREAEKAGLSIAEAARVCAENSWGGFKAEYLEQRRSAPVHQPTHNEVLDAQIRDWRESTARLNDMFGPQPEPYQDHYITEQYDQD